MFQKIYFTYTNSIKKKITKWQTVMYIAKRTKGSLCRKFRIVPTGSLPPKEKQNSGFCYLSPWLLFLLRNNTPFGVPFGVLFAYYFLTCCQSQHFSNVSKETCNRTSWRFFKTILCRTYKVVTTKTAALSLPGQRTRRMVSH